MAKKRKSAPKEEPSSQSKQLKYQPTPVKYEEEEEQQQEEEHPESEMESEEEEEEEEEDEGASSDSSESSESKLDSIKSLLQPLGKDQLINLLKEAAATNPSIAALVIKSADSDPIHRKIFIHGLGWDTTNETLTSALKHYGPIEECNVVADKTTGRSKGYGFVLFKTRAGARKALKEPQKKISNRMASCQLASAGPAHNPNHSHNPPLSSASDDASRRKLYVANVGPQIPVEKLRSYFAKFGDIQDGPLGLDKATGKFKGFALIVYKTVDGINKALEEPVKFFDGTKLQCSVATEGRNAKNNTHNVGAGATLAMAPNNNTTNNNNNLALQSLPVAFNPGAVLMGQNPALGVLNPVFGVSPGAQMNQMGLSTAFAAGVSQPLNRIGHNNNNKNNTTPLGLSAGFGVQPAMNSISPGVIGTYGSQVALQGLGVYQSSQLGQSSAPGRSHTGIGSVGTLPSYFR